MVIDELEKLEMLCHIRTCMLRARELLTGNERFKKEDVLEFLEDGMTTASGLILDARNRSGVDGIKKD